jgi:antirestriction protein ArdC
MSPNNTQRARGERGNLYQEVTDRIVSELEQGRFPWVQPWGAANAGLGLPKNAATSRRYSGINILILWGSVIEKSYRGQNWLTFRQALTLGGCVRKGEKGTTVFYADRFIPQSERDRAQKTGDDPNAIPFLKRFTVFNVDQCDGLPQTAFAGIAPFPECEALPHAEDLIKATGAGFRIGGARAFYQTAEDFIQVPPQPSFFLHKDLVLRPYKG